MVSSFKCKLCSMLYPTFEAAEEHLLAEHKDQRSNTNWLAAAQRHGITLDCTDCNNKFKSEGSRSFKAHAVDDHGLSESEACERFQEAQLKRQAAVMDFLEEKRRKDMDSQRTRTRQVLEAYVDNNRSSPVSST